MLRSCISGLSLAAALAAAPAIAQDATAQASPYVGLSGGYHDVVDNDLGDDGGAIGGVVAGVDLPVSAAGTRTVIVGAEGNFHLGTGAIDSEYGVAGRIGLRGPRGGIGYVRAGYQWVNFDIGSLSNGIIGSDDGFDDTTGDYIVGVGGEFPVGATGRSRLRVGVDSVSFDTWRPNVAYVLGF